MFSFGKATKARKNRRLARFVKKLGARHVGLGALMPAMTHYGLDLRKFYGDAANPPYVTTGHSLTALTIFQYLEGLVNARNPDEPICVAIVGAAGSTGSLCAKIIALWERASRGMVKLLLVDKKHGKLVKNAKLEKLAEHLRTITPAEILTSLDLNDLRRCDYVVTVTNAAEAIIRPEHVSPGAVIIDDSQPRNTSPELLMHGIEVIDVLAEIPGLNAHFDFGFKAQDTTSLFTCLAEVVLLAVTGETGDFSIGQVEYSQIERLRDLLQQTQIKPARYHTFTCPRTLEEISLILKPRTERLARLVESG